MLIAVLLVVALVLFVLATFGISNIDRLQTQPAGLFFLTLAFLAQVVPF